MIKLKELIIRLEKLPEKEKEKELAGLFRHYVEKVKSYREKLKQSRKDIDYIVQIYPNSEHEARVAQQLKTSVSIALELHSDIEKDQNTVKEEKTEKKIVRLGEYTSSARTRCDDAWNKEHTESLNKWNKVAEVVQNLGAKGGKEFRLVVDKLKMVAIPKNDKEVERIKKDLLELKKGIETLGLEGPFGKFLEATAGAGATSKELLNDDVRKKMDEYKLWDAFRVRLG